MDNDDGQVGRVLSRREVISLFGAAGVAMAVIACTDGDDGSIETSPTSAATAAATTAPTQTAAAGTATTTAALPSCIVRPELTEGPYFVDEMLNRSDIRIEPSDGSTKDGVPLTITFNVSEVSENACTPLANAMVDVWQCDALGVYSDVEDPGFDTSGLKFLRGYQMTDGEGKAEFLTIYPGWYQGRTVHIHFKIRTEIDSAGSEFTSQLFLDDDLTDQVHALAPYSEKGQRTLRNEGDGIYQQSGDQLLLQAVPSGDGYTATFDIGLQLS